MAAQEPPEKQFASLINKLHANGAYSDLKIVCGSDTYLVHKAIICPQSDFFRAACRPDTFSEGKSNTINIPASSGRGEAFYAQPCKVEDFDWDLDVETATSVKLMIHYLYHHDYHEVVAYADRAACLFSCNRRKGILSEHSRMYAMGEKYGIPGLKSVARAKFKRWSLMMMSHGGLATAIIVAYNTTPEIDKGLRETILQTLDIWRRTYSKDEEIQQIVSSIPELAYQLYRKMIEREEAVIGARQAQREILDKLDKRTR